MSVAALEPEEQARANFYALLARLLSAPPDRELLRALSAAAGLEAEGEPPGDGDSRKHRVFLQNVPATRPRP